MLLLELVFPFPLICKLIELDAEIIVDLLKDPNLANNSNAIIGISLSISLFLQAN